MSWAIRGENAHPDSDPAKKACPYCAEEIQEAAIVCRHCGRELDPEKVSEISLLAPPSPRDLGEQTKRTAPFWKIALRFGGIVAAVHAVYLISEFAQGRTNSAEFYGDLVLGPPSTFAVATAMGFVLARLARWKKWAPAALVILVITVLMGYGAWRAGDLRLGSFAPQPTATALSQALSAPPTGAVRQTITPTEMLATLAAVVHHPTSTPLPFYLAWPRYQSDNDYWLNSIDGANLRVDLLYTGVRFRADWDRFDNLANSAAFGYFCQAGAMYGLACPAIEDLLVQSIEAIGPSGTAYESGRSCRGVRIKRCVEISLTVIRISGRTLRVV